MSAFLSFLGGLFSKLFKSEGQNGANDLDIQQEVSLKLLSKRVADIQKRLKKCEKHVRTLKNQTPQEETPPQREL